MDEHLTSWSESTWYLGPYSDKIVTVTEAFVRTFSVLSYIAIGTEGRTNCSIWSDQSELLYRKGEGINKT